MGTTLQRKDTSKIWWQVQGHSLQLPVYLLPIAGADLVLGAAWLVTLGPHIADYSALSLKFYLGNDFVTLLGERPTLPSPAQFHHIKHLRLTQAIAECFTLHIQPIQDSTPTKLDLPDTLDPALTVLLLKYKYVFQTLIGLPPNRSHDHSIPLLEGSNPVKVTPYRYPHSQKEQIERMVTDKLKKGIIHPSTSHFSSPILLVKKMDGT